MSIKTYFNRIIWDLFIYPYRIFKYEDIQPEIGQKVNTGNAVGTITDINKRVIEVRGTWFLTKESSIDEPWVRRFHKIYFTEYRWNLRELCWNMVNVKDM